MTSQRFSLLLFATSIGVLVTNLILTFSIPSLQNHLRITWWSLLFFIIISIFMYMMGDKAMKSSNKYEFNHIVIGFVLFKMFVSIVIILLYKKKFHPESKLFIVPFFIVYFSFTIFETYFMTQLTRRKK